MPRRALPAVETLELKALLSVPGLAVSIKTDRAVYAIGEPVRITATETNTSGQDVTIGTSAYDGEFTVTYGGTVVWDNLEGQPIPQIIIDLTLHPGQSIVETATWDGVPNTGASAPRTGTFQVSRALDHSQEATFSIVAGPTPPRYTPSVPLSSLAGITLPGGPGTDTVPTVYALYQEILGRAPDQAGLAAATQALASGTPVAQVASDLLHSVEYETDLVASYYWGYLGRTGSSAEIASWVGAMQAGVSQEAVALDFLTSAEFQALHPSTADDVQAVYQEVLGRQATASEAAYWSGSAASPATIAQFVLTSPEADVVAIEGLYEDILGRPADGAGLAAAVGAVEGGKASLTDIAIGLLGSPEASQRLENWTTG